MQEVSGSIPLTSTTNRFKVMKKEGPLLRAFK